MKVDGKGNQNRQGWRNFLFMILIRRNDFWVEHEILGLMKRTFAANHEGDVEN